MHASPQTSYYSAMTYCNYLDQFDNPVWYCVKIRPTHSVWIVHFKRIISGHRWTLTAVSIVRQNSLCARIASACALYVRRHKTVAYSTLIIYHIRHTERATCARHEHGMMSMVYVWSPPVCRRSALQAAASVAAYCVAAVWCVHAMCVRIMCIVSVCHVHAHLSKSEYYLTVQAIDDACASSKHFTWKYFQYCDADVVCIIDRATTTAVAAAATDTDTDTDTCAVCVGVALLSWCCTLNARLRGD